ncbi:NarK/NasA family nitrate transporter [Pseudonocardia sp. KRD-184]|uniref:NarK/NasA family nitrate transporter n=1 Tax=Pseudonocardia oceani TaxID=2792013 RepID=A0ABS6UC54_9PSEU|nr:NarK/NasA family nitrate transporter [Pseudonocardia oceani]MBW0097655.1 NarK/NasA family nitrate transporter [Pseudonocardia oceani]MBW0110649.1 NarK/NasA family nitrate transporter [Pseudonocardia oceani]MBW0124211.1 NarK/NasA family nitrate transporter [Pseudonocardia oceani]MBW0129813.1 NarK/NasA family nitrate transporter [Pseudonocardia oceani]
MAGRWIDHWDPEDPSFWQRTGARVANRNLWFSILSEHIGFSIWTMWSVLVLFMGPEYGIDAAGKFFLVAVPTLVGAVLRLPYTFAVARFGGRNWTIVSALLLLIPTILAAVVMQPGTPYGVFIAVAAVGGLGGGNFASSMTNINAFFPERKKGWALGLNAGGGNIGVPVIQLIGLLVIATAGTGAPRILLGVYIPLIVVAAAFAAVKMDNLTSVKNDTGAFRESVQESQTWVMSFLYIGTFGSFIGYSFAFGLVLQNQFGRTPLEAAAVTFIGPLLGSLIRPVGGTLADRLGGARVTFWNFLAMVAATAVIIAASASDSLGLFTAGFVLLFVLTGLGNGSTYKMIPAIFRGQARVAIAGGADEAAAYLRARRISGAVIGIAGAVGALGGLFINLAFRQSFLTTQSGDTAYWSFLVFYVVCAVVSYVVYLRPAPADATAPRAAYAGV